MSRLAENEVRVPVAHASMQFSDSTKQKRHDAKAIFERERERGAWWITGTEAGPGASQDLRDALAEEAKAFGFTFFVRGDSWVSFDKARIVRGSMRHGFEFALDSSEGDGKHTDKGVGWASIENEDIGRITVGSVHYLTRGRPDSRSPLYRVNLDENRRYAEVVGKWGREHGRGKALVFVQGDVNIVDRIADVFLGEADFTTSWDELGRWENTGHGNIDVLASYDRDGRVRALGTKALDDSEFPLATDHFLVEGAFAVKRLGRPS